jgi:hypothetical protein
MIVNLLRPGSEGGLDFGERPILVDIPRFEARYNIKL